MDDPNNDFQNEDILRCTRSADPKPAPSPGKKLTAAEKRKSTAPSSALQRSKRSLRSDVAGFSSLKQEGREPFKSPQVLTGTTD
jgi:hypothetical protein